MTGAPRVIEIHYADQRTLSAEAVDALVTTEDRERLAPAMQPRRRAEYLAARALLRHALERHMGRDGRAFNIRGAAGSKPECVGGPAISVAHSGELVVCAVAESGAIGIDVETVQARESIVAIARRYFTGAEAQWLDADPEPRFRMLWVLKEAYLKALGVGLAGGLASLECRIEPPAIVARVAHGAAPQLTLLAGPGCYVGVAAVDAARVKIVVKRWAPTADVDAFGPLAVVATTE